MKHLPRVSFIIPTLNAEKHIEKCLVAIRGQNYPQKLVEIVVADAGSTDKTLSICQRFDVKVISNPEILHEPGKARASEVASGEILFFTDADNILSSKAWLKSMVKPYLETPGVKGFLPQTIADPHDNSLNRYLSWLSTDPFTWFVYGNAATPRTWGEMYQPVKTGDGYGVYKFDVLNHPLLGLSQGFGTAAKFKRDKMAHNDDILAGIKLIAEGGLIAYVPTAGIYHYHVSGWPDFMNKYRWRIRNNLTQKVKGMGLVNRNKYMNRVRRIRQILFLPYSLSIAFPVADTLRLVIRYRDPAMLWHLPTAFGQAVLIIKEVLMFILGKTNKLGDYGK